MDNPRPEKVAVVDEVREKLTSAEAVLFTEYRGLTVRQLADLRKEMRDGGGEYRIYKNSLVRMAAQNLDLEVEKDFSEELTGPTAIAFVGQKPDGTPGDAVLVAKALQIFAKANPQLIVKGGFMGAHVLTAEDAKALANVAPREELLSRFASGLAAPMREFAALLQAVPASFAYGLAALIEAGGASDAPAATAPEAATEDAPATDAAAETTDAPATDAAAETTDAPATDAAAETTEDTPAEADDSAETTEDTPAADAAAEQE